MSGLPRITRPPRRKNAGNLSGFSLVDPAGNWIRVVTDSSRAAPEGPQPQVTAEAQEYLTELEGRAAGTL